MIDLGLNRPAVGQLSERDLEQARARSVRARELLANAHFVWWRGVATEGLQKMRNKVVHSDITEVQRAVLRGKIQGVAQILRELEMMAESLESIEAQLARLQQ